MNRRKLIAGISASTLLLLQSVDYQAASSDSAVVYKSFDERMVSENKPDRTKVVEKVVIAAVNSTIVRMSGQKDIGKAWQKLLPGVTPLLKIAIKLNLLHPYNGPQFATLKAVVLGLQSMSMGSFPPVHIFAFDNTSRRVDAHYGTRNLDVFSHN